MITIRVSGWAFVTSYIAVVVSGFKAATD